MKQIERIIEKENLSNLGIRIVTAIPVPSKDDLPVPYIGAYGDGYLVGDASPYELYVWTRENNEYGGVWFDWGPLNAPSIVPGPKGDKGDKGDQGARGSLWYVGTSDPAPSSSYNVNDMYLNIATGNVFTMIENGNWQLQGSIKGPQGLQGIQGLQGLQGIQGIQGEVGPQGVPGKPFTIGGIVATTNLLPEPTAEIQNLAYLVGTAGDYNMYVIVGDTTSPYVWVNMGKVTAVDGPKGDKGDKGDTGAQGPQGEAAHPIYLSTYGPSGNYIPTQYLTPTSPKAAANDYIITVSGELYRVVADQGGIQVQVTYITSLIGPAGFSPTAVELTTTSGSGTLTDGQWSILTANDLNYIVAEGETYELSDVTSTYRTYTHTGLSTTSNKFYIKSIYINIASKSWLKKQQQIIEAAPRSIYTHLVSAIQNNNGTVPIMINFTLTNNSSLSMAGSGTTGLSNMALELTAWGCSSISTLMPATGYVHVSSSLPKRSIVAVYAPTSYSLSYVYYDTNSSEYKYDTITSGTNLIVRDVKTKLT